MKKFLLLFLLTGFLWSCSSDDDTVEEEIINTSILPTKITYSNPDPDLNFEVLIAYDGKKITKMTSVMDPTIGNIEAVYQYDGDKITKITTTLGDEISTTTYTYADNRLATAKVVWEGVGTTEYIYEWVNANHVKLTTVDSSRITEFHLDNGNIVKVRDNFGGSDWIHNYTFDTKHRPFKNVEGFQYLIEEDDLHSFNINNVIKEVTNAGSNTWVTDHTYDYNAQDFPTKQTIKTEDETTVYTFTYNQ